MNVVFRQDDERARVFVDTTWGRSTWGSPPASMLNAIGAPLDHGPALPWSLPSTFAEVPRLQLPPPVAEVLSVEDGGRHLARVRLRSQRGAPTLALLLTGKRYVDVNVDGHRAMPRAAPGGMMLALHAVPSEGVVVELESPGTSGPISFTLLDRSTGVPAGTKAADAVRSRPNEATAFQDGDVTIVTTHASL
ncbi:MAG TPA: hypothetical protein VM925_00765 [Labilithrix sp.]|nr:hypothetical protein [Labilithrix sp.]